MELRILTLTKVRQTRTLTDIVLRLFVTSQTDWSSFVRTIALGEIYYCPKSFLLKETVAVAVTVDGGA